MKKPTLLNIIIVLFSLLLVTGSGLGFTRNNHIKEMDSLRTSMAELGNGMPELIKNAKPPDIRTLERVFEINTYALTTIEAYFKMMKLAASSNAPIDCEMIGVLNGWLDFINKYCKSDIEYFNEALSQTKDQSIINLIERARINIKKLGEISSQAIDENKGLLRR